MSHRMPESGISELLYPAIGVKSFVSTPAEVVSPECQPLRYVYETPPRIEPQS
jgi:hypothetical protein